MQRNGGSDEGGTGAAHRHLWEPPWGPSRAAGGLLGVIGGEADGWADTCTARRFPSVWRRAVSPCGPVADALLDVARAYTESDGSGVPVEIAARHEGVAAPAWLLAVAVVRPRRADQVADTLELATAAGVPRRCLGACVAYVELAAGLYSGLSGPEAVRSGNVDLSGVADPGRAGPPLCGESTADALTAGAWALFQDAPADRVVATVSRNSTPGVGAAVAGLLGLRDGCGALPRGWHAGVESDAVCSGLVPRLVRARCNGAATSRRLEAGAVPGTRNPAHVITRGTEAIDEDRFLTGPGVGQETSSSGHGGFGRWSAWQRQLEGAVRR